MPSNRIITLALILFLAPPMFAIAWMNQQKCDELRAIPAYQLTGKVLMFYSPRCGGCTTMMPVVSQLQKEGYSIQTINVNENSSQAADFGIRSIPTFIYLKDGKEQYRSKGRMQRAKLEDFCRGIHG